MNSQVYVTELLQPFIAQLMEEEREYACFLQDGATAHTSRFSMPYVHEAFGEESTVSTVLWLPRSPDLSTCDFYLLGNLKAKVYSNNPHTIEELKTNIRVCPALVSGHFWQFELYNIKWSSICTIWDQFSAMNIFTIKLAFIISISSKFSHWYMGG